MKILVLNCGSSSVKYQLIEMEREEVVCKGIVERIGAADAILRYEPAGGPELREVRPVANHAQAIDAFLGSLMDAEIGVIHDRAEIGGVGHRVVHGGESFASSVRIDDAVLDSIQECAAFAPLHNPHNLEGIRVCAELLPGIPQVAVFDTAFHQTMPATAYLYALPYDYYRRFKVRRYGFHGTSHHYVSRRAAEILGQPASLLRVVTCHLGNGASVAAVDGGRSVDTSMGFTPLEGLVMGTRCGDIDPALVLYLMREDGLTPAEMDDLLNKKSGMLGLTELSHDMRDIEAKARDGDLKCDQALDIYCQRIKKYIGAYAAVMNGVDAVVFTGGIGEKSEVVRRRVCRGMEYLGIVFDDAVNQEWVPWNKQTPSTPHLSSGPTKVLVIPTNEELVIARDTCEILCPA
ncbi:MAG: acetate kinase [Anaerolineae bacterium]|nr:acetate kinase [Anaerolineae bacterium]